MKTLLEVIAALPRWLLALAAVVFIVAMGSSWYTGEPFVLGGVSFGWSRPQVEKLIVSQPRNELEWQQKKYVSDLMMRPPSDIGEYRDEILKCYPNFRVPGFAASGTLISEQEAHRIIDGSLSEHKKLYEALVVYLNRLEGLSAAYQNGVADATMFEASYKGVIKTWYGRLYKFMPVAMKKCDCSWEPFEMLGKKWWTGSQLPESFGIQGACFGSKS